MAEQPATILGRIVEKRRQRVNAAASVGGQDRYAPDVRHAKSLWHSSNAFLSALAKRRGKAIIAEIKMGSPSLGSLKGTFQPQEQAKLYADHGAAALSVVVEPDYFYGSYQLLETCKRACGLPAIAKDFIVHPIQLRWASQAGADAVLLVASLYSETELAAFASGARHHGLAPLIEIHSLADLQKLGSETWELVGVNNRDLHTFQVAIENSLALASVLPGEALKVSESGIHDRSQLSMLAGTGFDAFLIGESLITAEDPARVLRDLLS